jgi:succinate dehydrogenase / fumarate reductase cytochrome b subunit
MSTASTATVIPRPFVLRRLHSLTGLLLTLYIALHLLTYSQAALPVGEDGAGFVRMINAVHHTPFLWVLEWMLIGIPLIIHATLGIRVALQASFKSFRTDGSKPSLPQYARNQAYTWQRITSWILLVGIIAHVVQMRFLNRPEAVPNGASTSYLVKVTQDIGIYTVADRLRVALYSADQISQERQILTQEQQSANVNIVGEQVLSGQLNVTVIPSAGSQVEAQHLASFQKYVRALSSYDLSPNEFVAVCADFGTALLLSVRDTMKSASMCLLYTILVLAGAFHAFNGLWVFSIHWGVVLSAQSQRWMAHICMGLFALFAFLGLAAVWGTYWLNLRS